MEASTPSDPRTTASTMPKETIKTADVLGSRSPRAEVLPVSSSLMRQPCSSATSVIMSTPHSPGGHQTSLRSPSREGAPHSSEREPENMKDGKQRVCYNILWNDYHGIKTCLVFIKKTHTSCTLCPIAKQTI